MNTFNNNNENNLNYFNNNIFTNNMTNNAELMDIRRQLKELYDMKKQFYTNLSSYEKNK